MGEIIKVTCYSKGGMARHIAKMVRGNDPHHYVVKMYEIRPFLIFFRIHTAVLVRSEAAFFLRKRTGPVTERGVSCP
jgi:hypothetical protein